MLAALSAAGKVIQTKPGHHAIIECGVKIVTTMLEWRHGDFTIFVIDEKTGSSRRGTSNGVDIPIEQYRGELNYKAM